MVFKMTLIGYDDVIDRVYTRENTIVEDFVNDCKKFKRIGINELIGMNEYITMVDVLKRISHNLYKNKYLRANSIIDTHYIMAWNEFIPTFDNTLYDKYNLDILSNDDISRIVEHNKKIKEDLFPFI